jgi:hypothetical protein
MKPIAGLSLLLACGGNVDQTVIDAAVAGSDKESGASTDGLVSNDTEASTVESGAADDGPLCPSGETACAGVCVGTQTDDDNCGACGIFCGLGICRNGACFYNEVCVPSDSGPMCYLP